MFAYFFYLDDYCNKFSQNLEKTEYKKKINIVNLRKLSDCRSNYFCEVKNEQKYLGRLYKYDCKKEIIDRYELDFYTDLYNNFINKYFK